MDLNVFQFFTETITPQMCDDQFMIDFALKCYNLFLLFFYFNIIKWVVAEFQRIVRRFAKWTRF